MKSSKTRKAGVPKSTTSAAKRQVDDTTEADTDDLLSEEEDDLETILRKQRIDLAKFKTMLAKE